MASIYKDWQPQFSWCEKWDETFYDGARSHVLETEEERRKNNTLHAQRSRHFFREKQRVLERERQLKRLLHELAAKNDRILQRLSELELEGMTRSQQIKKMKAEVAEWNLAKKKLEKELSDRQRRFEEQLQAAGAQHVIRISSGLGSYHSFDSLFPTVTISHHLHANHRFKSNMLGIY